jgi:hypothetical protein
MFSIFVKRKIFTKHMRSQWMALNSFPSEVIAAVQPLATQRWMRIEGGGRPDLFSKIGERAAQAAPLSLRDNENHLSIAPGPG